jgi:hypothetical protein
MERWFALAGMIICFINLIAYCTYQVRMSSLILPSADMRYRHYLLRLYF